MSLTAAALISAGAGLASSYLGASKSNSAAKQQMQFQWLQQQQQQAWEKQKMLNAHQWEMQDLKKAGLNPALTAMGGQGASGGSIGMGAGAMPDTSGYTAGANSLLSGIEHAINSAQTQQRIGIENANSQADIALKQAEAVKKATESNILTEYGKKEAAARIQSSLANASLMAGGAKTANVIGDLVERGGETLKRIEKHSIPTGDIIGDIIGGLLPGGDRTKQSFQYRMQKAKMNSAKNAKQAWDNILK